MDSVRLHLVVDHSPIIPIVTGLLATIAAPLARTNSLRTCAAVTVPLADIASPVAHLAGVQAEQPPATFDADAVPADPAAGDTAGEPPA